MKKRGAIGIRTDLKLYRRRYIPNENVHLRDDILLYADDKIIVTKWNCLKPRQDFARGYSCYFLEEDYKVSWHINADGTLTRYYCDIIETEHDTASGNYIFHDLLVDVVIMPDGFVKVLDLNEIPEALGEGLISTNKAMHALTVLDKLLGLIYDGRFHELTAQAMPYIQTL